MGSIVIIALTLAFVGVMFYALKEITSIQVDK